MTHSLPATIVTDNGPTFISHEFRDFLKECGILHVTSTPYHPATNGLAECGVQTLKQGLQKLEGNMQDRLSRFLFFYRLSPHAQLLACHQLKCYLVDDHDLDWICCILT